MTMPNDLTAYCADEPDTDYLNISADAEQTAHVFIWQHNMYSPHETSMQLRRDDAIRLRDWLNAWLEETK